MEQKPTVIKFDGINNNTLIWRHPEQLGYNAVILVRENTEAMFIKNGQILEVFSQPGEYKVNEKKESLFFKFKKTEQPLLDCQIYYVNKSAEQTANWGTPSRIDFVESQTGIRASVGACGTYKIGISNPRKVLGKIMGLSDSIDMDKIAEYFKVEVSSAVRNGFANALITEKRPYFELAANELSLSNRLKGELNKLFDEYGLKVTNFSIKNISFSDNLKERLAELDLQQYIKNVNYNTERELIKKKEQDAAKKKEAEQKIEAAKTVISEESKPLVNNSAKKETQIEQNNNLSVCCETENKEPEQQKMLLLDGSDEEIEVYSGNQNENPAKEDFKVENDLKICPFCNAKIPANMKFCGECGKKL